MGLARIFSKPMKHVHRFLGFLRVLTKTLIFSFSRSFKVSFICFPECCLALLISFVVFRPKLRRHELKKLRVSILFCRSGYPQHLTQIVRHLRRRGLRFVDLVDWFPKIVKAGTRIHSTRLRLRASGLCSVSCQSRSRINILSSASVEPGIEFQSISNSV